MKTLISIIFMLKSVVGLAQITQVFEEIKSETKTDSTRSIVEPPIDGCAYPLPLDVEPSFPGGIANFRKKVADNFNMKAFNGKNKEFRSTISFIIEKDGSISNITAKGNDALMNKESIKAVKRVKGKWFPRSLNGNFVRSEFSFPMVLNFE